MLERSQSLWPSRSTPLLSRGEQSLSRRERHRLPLQPPLHRSGVGTLPLRRRRGALVRKISANSVRSEDERTPSNERAAGCDREIAWKRKRTMMRPFYPGTLEGCHDDVSGFSTAESPDDTRPTISYTRIIILTQQRSVCLSVGPQEMPGTWYMQGEAGRQDDAHLPHKTQDCCCIHMPAHVYAIRNRNHRTHHHHLIYQVYR